MIVATRNFALLSACILLAACSQEPAKTTAAAKPAAAAAVPAQDIAALVNRIQMCRHFSGEYGDDPARNREIGAEQDKLKCGSVDADEAAARKTADAATHKKFDEADKF